MPNKNDRDPTEEYGNFDKWLGHQESDMQTTWKQDAADEAKYRAKQKSLQGDRKRDDEDMYEHMLQKQMEKEVMEQERAARERLAKRLEAAAEAEPLMIEDGVNYG